MTYHGQIVQAKRYGYANFVTWVSLFSFFLFCKVWLFSNKSREGVKKKERECCYHCSNL